MRILHVMLACFYNEGYTYQENILPQMNKEDGHDVKIIASTEVFKEGGRTGYTKPIKYINNYGIEVVRLAYKKIMPHKLIKKIRFYDGLKIEIENFKPDVIFCHSLMFGDLKVIADYKKKNPKVKLFADNHSDFNNSATNFISRNVLHKMIYKPIISKYVNNFEKIFYLTKETKIFLDKIYKINQDLLEYYPLGGIIEEDNTRAEHRKLIRKNLYLDDEDIMLLHSGKMDKGKKTINIIKALQKIDNPRLKLFIVGVFEEEYGKTMQPLIQNDSRVVFVGWKTGEELLEYMCAADLYLQPGSQSAAAQNAACSNCGLAVAPHISYKDLFGDTIFYAESSEQIKNLLESISENKHLLESKRRESFLLAKEKLDYKMLSRRYLN